MDWRVRVKGSMWDGGDSMYGGASTWDGGEVYVNVGW